MGDGSDLPLRFFLQPGERQVFKHQACQLVHRHLYLIGQLPWLIPWLAIPWVVPIAVPPSQDIAWLSWALAHALLGLPIFETILFQIAQRDFDTFMPIGSDDRFLSDQFAQIFTNRLFDTLIVP